MSKFIDVLLKGLKIIVFASLIVAAGFMYAAGMPLHGNDLMLTAAVVLCLNKLGMLVGD